MGRPAEHTGQGPTGCPRTEEGNLLGSRKTASNRRKRTYLIKTWGIVGVGKGEAETGRSKFKHGLKSRD